MTLDCEDDHFWIIRLFFLSAWLCFLWAIFTATCLNIMINRNILIMNQSPMDGKYFQWLLFIGKYNLCLFVQSFNDESVLNWCILWNNDKYFLSDESHPNGWLILMMNPFQMDGKKSLPFPYLFVQFFINFTKKDVWNLWNLWNM